jgi:DNA-binding NtrC family response regulator
VVDDDRDMCWVLETALATLGRRVTSVATARHAIDSAAAQAFAIAFVDARLPDRDGLSLIEELRGLRPAMRIIMISGYYLKDDARIVEAMQRSAIDGFLAKPFRIDAVLAAVAGDGGGECRP